MTDELTPQELQELNFLEAKTAKAPWANSYHILPGNRCALGTFGATIIQGTGSEGSFADNAAFVIKVRNLWSKIAKTLKNLREENEHIRANWVPLDEFKQAQKEILKERQEKERIIKITVPKQELENARAVLGQIQTEWAPKGTKNEKYDLFEKLKKYGSHRGRCLARFHKAFKCSCGLDEALKQ